MIVVTVACTINMLYITPLALTVAIVINYALRVINYVPRVTLQIVASLKIAIYDPNMIITGPML
jgi:hypothetical protein